MSAQLTFNRPKLTPTIPLNTYLILKDIVEDGVTTKFIFCLEEITQDSINLTGLSYTSGNHTVTASSPTIFTNVKLGDVINFDEEDFSGGTYVSAKPTATTLTMSSNPSATRSNTTGTVQSKTIDATVYILEVVNNMSGSSLTPTVKIYTYDGTKVYDADNSGGYDAVTTSDGLSKVLGTTNINLDSFYSNARIARIDYD